MKHTKRAATAAALTNDDVATPAQALRAILSSEVRLISLCLSLRRISNASKRDTTVAPLATRAMCAHTHARTRNAQVFAKSDPKALRTLALSICAMTATMWCV